MNNQSMRQFSGDGDCMHWIRHVEMLAASNGWDETKTLHEACAALTGSACCWLDSVHPYGRVTTWQEFRAQLCSHFSEKPRAVMQKLQACKQFNKETVAQFAVRFRMLASKLAHTNNAIPQAMLISMFIQNLRAELRYAVLHKQPETLDEAIVAAEYFDEMSDLLESAIVPNGRNHLSNVSNQNAAAPQNFRQQDLRNNKPRNRPQENRPQENRPPQNAGQRNWPPRGHKPTAEEQELEQVRGRLDDLHIQEAEIEQRMARKYGQYVGQLVDTHEDGLYEDYPDAYSKGWDGSARRRYYEAYEDDVDMPDAPIQHRRPRKPVGFDPANLPRPGPGPRGPQGRAPPPPDQAPPRNIGRPALPQALPQRPAMPPIPAPARRTARSAAGTFHVVDQLQGTAAKVSIAELLRLAPSVRADARAMLDQLDAEDRRGHQAQNTAYSAMECSEDPFPEPVRKDKSNKYLSKAYQHQRYDNSMEAITGISVVRASIRVCSTEVSAVVDSGASHTMMSDVLARKLHLYKHIQPTKAKFFTAAGKLERPVGRLPDVPITVGTLTLPVDVYVSPARTYSILLGNNFLAAAEAQINFGAKELIYRKDMEIFEAIPIEFVEDEGDNVSRMRCNFVSMQQDMDSEDTKENQNPRHQYAQLVPAGAVGEMENDDQEDEDQPQDQEQPMTSQTSDSESTFDDDDSVWVPSISETDSSLSSDDAFRPWQSTYSEYKRISFDQSLIGKVMTVERSNEPRRDTDDWMFDSSQFAVYNEKFGPFSIEACASDDGSNAHLPEHWCPSNSCLDNSWIGHTVFCNPPWRLIQPILEHFLCCREQDPEHTHAVFVLPNWPWQSWYPKIMQHFDMVDYFPTGSQLFTAQSPLNASQESRLVLGPTRWPVMVLRSTGDKAIDGHNWDQKYKPPVGKAAIDCVQDVPEAKSIDSWKLGEHLTQEQKDDLQQRLDEQPGIWAWTEEQMGRTTAVAHTIDTGDAMPLKQRPYRLAPAEDRIVESQVDKWLQAGIVQPSCSPWASPVVLAKKKPLDPSDPNEPPKFRLCVDFRKLNEVTKSDSFPLPMVQDAIDTLGNACYFSIIDLRSAFLQLPIAPADREKTAFVTKQGLFEFTVLPFGLKNSPSVFQRLMHEVLRELQGRTCMVFLDDIIVFSVTWEEHLQRLREVIDRLMQYNLRAQPFKCTIGTDKLLYLGHIISAEGNLPDPAKVIAVRGLEPPTTLTQVRAYLGLVGYYRRFIPNFAQIANPLHSLLKRSSEKVWGPECQQAFEALKQALLEAPILKRPTPDDPFILQTDWSGHTIAAVLCQLQEGKEHPIAYASRSLSVAERNYSATEGECLAVVWACKYFRQYLWGRPFTLQTDHIALKWLMSTKDLTGKLARWSLRLQEYDFNILYRPGRANANADALTRLPVADNDNENPTDDDAVDEDVVNHLCTAGFVDEEEDDAPPIKRPRSAAASGGGGRRINFSHAASRPDQDPSEASVPLPVQHSTVARTMDHHKSVDPPRSGIQPMEVSTVRQQSRNTDQGHDETNARISTVTLALPKKKDRVWPWDRDPALKEELRRIPMKMKQVEPGVYEKPTFQDAYELRYGPLPEDNDDSDSVEPCLPCEVCHQPDSEHVMLVCDSCNLGYHTYCLRPRLYEIPEGAWYCGNCGGPSQRSHGFKDITQDQNVLHYLEFGTCPVDCGPVEKRRVVKRAKNYQLNADDKLCRKPVGSYSERPVCAIEERPQRIEECHRLGHWGVLRTAAMVAERFYWGGIIQDCKEYIRNCPACKLENVHFAQPQGMRSIPINDQSFFRVGIDLMGPLQTSTSGNKYVVVAVDYLTKWPEVAAIPDKTSKTVAEFFLRDIIARHGCPKEVLSDNGSEFFGEFDQLLQNWYIDHRLTSPNHPQANGLVERFNGTLGSALRKCVAESPGNWDQLIPTVLLGYRASLQASTKFSPFYMLYARMPTLPSGAAAATIDLEEDDPEQAAQTIMDKTARLREVTEAAVENITKAQNKQQRDYKTKRKHVEPTNLKAGDFVVIKAKARKSKLASAARPEIVQLVAFANEEKTVAIVRDNDTPPRRWKENISNIALYTDMTLDDLG